MKGEILKTIQELKDRASECEVLIIELSEEELEFAGEKILSINNELKEEITLIGKEIELLNKLHEVGNETERT